jgi:phage baseplate assembly protein gpV
MPRTSTEALFAPTQPDPSQREIARQGLLISELFKRIDALANAVLAQKPPEVTVQAGAAPQVTVEAAQVNVPAPVINVAQPDFKMDNAVVNVAAPVVNVAAPEVTVNPPQVHVSAPNVSVAAPSVTVQAPDISLTPSISIPYPRSLTFTHTLDHRGNVVSSTVVASE